MPASSRLPALRRLRILVAAALGVLAAACGQEGEGATTATTSQGGGGGGQGGGGTGGGGGGPAGTPLTVLNWNTHSLWNDKNDSDAEKEEVLSTKEYEDKLALVGGVLAEVDADFVVLQEVENQGVLDRLNDDHLGGAYLASAIERSYDIRGLDIGILSKVQIAQVVTHKDDSFKGSTPGGPNFKYTRDALEVHVDFADRKLVFIGVHFRSKGPPDDADRRLAEAERTRAIADGLAKEDPERGILILGDYNDLPGSAPYDAVIGAGETAYSNAPMVLPSEDRWSFDYQGKLELIDHQMANPVLAPMLDETSVRIVHRDDTACAPEDPDCASDHAPLIATYRFQ